MAITLQQARDLQIGEILYANFHFNRKGQPSKIRITGQVKTWKRDPSRVQVPYKHGLYDYGYITEDNLSDWCFTPEQAIDEMKIYLDLEKKIYLDPNTGLTIRT